MTIGRTNHTAFASARALPVPRVADKDVCVVNGVIYVPMHEQIPSNEKLCPGCVASPDIGLCYYIVVKAGCYTEKREPVVWVRKATE